MKDVFDRCVGVSEYNELLLIDDHFDSFAKDGFLYEFAGIHNNFVCEKLANKGFATEFAFLVFLSVLETFSTQQVFVVANDVGQAVNPIIGLTTAETLIEVSLISIHQSDSHISLQLFSFVGRLVLNFLVLLD